MEPQDLLSLRLTHKEITDHKTDAFADKFLTNVIWSDTALSSAKEKADGLKLQSDFSLRIKDLRIVFDWFARFSHVPAMKGFLDDINTLQDLRTLRLDSLEIEDGAGNTSWAQIQIPQLEILIISNSSCHDVSWIIDIIHNHYQTLKSVRLNCLAVDERGAGRGKSSKWCDLLHAFKKFRLAAIIEVTQPMVQAAFQYIEDAVSNGTIQSSQPGSACC